MSCLLETSKNFINNKKKYLFEIFYFAIHKFKSAIKMTDYRQALRGFIEAINIIPIIILSLTFNLDLQFA